MKFILLYFANALLWNSLSAQDTLYVKGGEKLVVEKWKLRQQQYRFTYDNGSNKGTVIQTLIDSVYTAKKQLAYLYIKIQK